MAIIRKPPHVRLKPLEKAIVRFMQAALPEEKVSMPVLAVALNVPTHQLHGQQYFLSRAISALRKKGLLVDCADRCPLCGRPPRQHKKMPVASDPEGPGVVARSLSPKSHPDFDAVMTPPKFAAQLVQRLPITGIALDPARGTGAFYQALQQSPAGIVEWCELAEGRDFLAWQQPVDWIVTNPPWSKFKEFLAHAMHLAPHVAFLVTVNHWWTKARVEMVTKAGFGYRQLWLTDYPKVFPESGFQLGFMHIERGYTGDLAIIDRRTWRFRKGKKYAGG